ncbi:MAG: phospho-sugar mutase [Verrucomicrobiae bacterium]|nr:phospho-sugar mutase [Verrucomicrobiae bacterium]
MFDLVRKNLTQARDRGLVLPSAHDNCLFWLDGKLFEPWVLESVRELVEKEQWSEINDRFYKTLAFGTGGLRGRTVGRVVTSAEQEGGAEEGCPRHPAVGSNCMNDFNVRRATMGLINYLRKVAPEKTAPHVVFAHDTRFFSRHFAELAGNTVAEMGGKATLFEGCRATPELSFAVRELVADAGVVVTASHNPSHDNGYKVYFCDGAQVVEPHASGIIREVNAVDAAAVCARGGAAVVESAGRELDCAYATRVLALVVEPEVVRNHGGKLKIVYSPLHGTGAVLVPGLLKEMGAQVLLVEEQVRADGRFPTVKSPNPENAEALSMSIALAEREKADMVLATDPDCDRMGVAVRNRQGRMELLSGNQIGSLMAHYRLERLFAQGILNPTNRHRARLIKTVVTTDLQKAIAKKFKVPIPETLTGFKYIGEKLELYERQLLQAAGMDTVGYRRLSEKDKRDLLLKHSCYYVFGGEESYGYSAHDYERDKDANAAAVMFAELAVYAKAQGLSVLEYMDSIYAELGFYREKLGQLVFEGAEGAAKIGNILKSYEKAPPKEMNGQAVVSVRDYATEEIRDCEDKVLPKERLFFVELQNGARYAVRGSGTEPKIKFYLFAHEKPPHGKRFEARELDAVRERTIRFLEELWVAIEKDARRRADLA